MSEIKHGVPTLGFVIPWMGGMVASHFPISPIGLVAVTAIAFITIIAQERACK